MPELARSASRRGELVLRTRPSRDGTGEVVELRANGLFVMDTEETSSEVALAAAALALLPRDARDLHVLVGGLGLGFTAQAVLADARVGRCTVAELEPALVGWLREGTVPHGPALLADPRLEVVVDDVARVLADGGDAAYGSPRFDLVLLDVDNGPDNLVHQANAALYEAPLLEAARGTLRAGGVLVVWSAARSPALDAALRSVFGDAAVDELRCPVDLQGRAEDYWLHLARVPSGA